MQLLAAVADHPDYRRPGRLRAHADDRRRIPASTLMQASGAMRRQVSEARGTWRCFDGAQPAAASVRTWLTIQAALAIGILVADRENSHESDARMTLAPQACAVSAHPRFDAGRLERIRPVAPDRTAPHDPRTHRPRPRRPLQPRWYDPHGRRRRPRARPGQPSRPRDDRKPLIRALTGRLHRALDNHFEGADPLHPRRASWSRSRTSPPPSPPPAPGPTSPPASSTSPPTPSASIALALADLGRRLRRHRSP